MLPIIVLNKHREAICYLDDIECFAIKEYDENLPRWIEYRIHSSINEENLLQPYTIVSKDEDNYYTNWDQVNMQYRSKKGILHTYMIGSVNPDNGRIYLKGDLMIKNLQDDWFNNCYRCFYNRNKNYTLYSYRNHIIRH